MAFLIFGIDVEFNEKPKDKYCQTNYSLAEQCTTLEVYGTTSRSSTMRQKEYCSVNMTIPFFFSLSFFINYLFVYLVVLMN